MCKFTAIESIRFHLGKNAAPHRHVGILSAPAALGPSLSLQLNNRNTEEQTPLTLRATWSKHNEARVHDSAEEMCVDPPMLSVTDQLTCGSSNEEWPAVNQKISQKCSLSCGSIWTRHLPMRKPPPTANEIFIFHNRVFQISKKYESCSWDSFVNVTMSSNIKCTIANIL